MLRWRKRIRKMSYVLTDMVCLLVAFILGEVLYEGVNNAKLVLTGFERISFVMLFILLQIMMYLILNVYEDTIENYGVINLKIVVKMFIAIGVAIVFIGAVLFYMKVSLSRGFLLNFTGFIVGLTIVNRIILKQFVGSKGSDKNNRNIIVIGNSERGYKYIEEIKKHRYLNFNILGYVSIKGDQPYEGIRLLGDMEDLEKIVVDYVVDEIAVARSMLHDSRMFSELSACQNMGVTVTMLLETHNSNAYAQVAMVGDVPVLKFHTVSLNESQLFAKRSLDVIGSMVGMVLFGIAFLIVGPIIKMETPGPVIFKQDRVGRNGRVFKVWKFRSMGINAEKEKDALMANNEMSGHMFKMSDDPRITKIGAFIRKTSIDELPQFYNVLKGDMSLVGTRPPTVKEVKEYETHHHKRISITPGITGNWQVSGRSDIEDFEEVVRLDEEYIKGWTILSDVRILFKTVMVVFKREGSK